MEGTGVLVEGAGAGDLGFGDLGFGGGAAHFIFFLFFSVGFVVGLAWELMMVVGEKGGVDFG